MPKKDKGIISTLFYLSIVLACSNFFGHGNFFCFLVLGLNTALLLWTGREIEFDIECLLGILFFVGAGFAAGLFFGFEEALKGCNVFMAYFVGRNTYKQISTQEEKKEFVKKLAFCVFLGFSAYLIGTWLFNVIKPHQSARCLYNPWSTSYGLIAVTLIGLQCSVIIGYSFYAFFFQKNNAVKIFTGISVFVCLLLNIRTATRTPLLLFGLIYAFMTVVSLGRLNKKLLKTVGLTVLAVIGVTALVLITDLFGLRHTLFNIPIIKRLIEDGFSTPRIQEYIAHFKGAPFHLIGGLELKAEVGNYAHNFLQDAHDRYGFCALIAMFGFGAGFVMNLFSLLFTRGKTGTDYLLLSLNAAIFIQVCLEPVFSGYPLVIWTAVLLYGVTTSHLQQRGKGL